MRLQFSIFFACMLLVHTGCTSMTSTMLTRDESNQFWTRKGKLKGVPITLKVPTHVQLTVFETHYLIRDEQGITHRLPLPFVVRDFSQEFIYTEKIFTVDFKRPAAGLYNLHLLMTDDQYIAKLQHDVTDNTIQEVTSLVGRFFPSGLGPRTAGDEEPPEQILQDVQSVVAVDIFEIDAPDFEQQMSAFINCHLNQSHDAFVAPPDVKVLQRTSLSGATIIAEEVPRPAPNAIPPNMGTHHHIQ